MTRAATPPNPLAGTHTTAEERMLRIKKDLHQKLIAELDLSAIGTMGEEELREEVRRGPSSSAARPTTS